jgi:hypothetical protein
MTAANSSIAIQLSSIINAYNGRNGTTGLSGTDARLLSTRALAAIDRAAPPGSAYLTQAKLVTAHEGSADVWQAEQLVAIVEALRDDYREGAMKTVEELVHADLFGDFLDLATELSAKRFLGPAAVVAGSVLEEHLRKLASKHSIETRDEKGRPKSVETLSVELRNAEAFAEVQRKTVVAWYAWRSEAAHGRFDGLVDSDIDRMIEGIRDFVARYPA